MEEHEQDYDNDLGLIATALKRESVQFLFGAGMSFTSKLLSFNDLAQRIIKECLFEGRKKKPDEEELKKLASSFSNEVAIEGIEKHQNKSKAITKIINEEFVEKSKSNEFVYQDDNPYKIFNELLNEIKYLKTILTTNFDSLFKKVLDDRAIEIKNWEDCKDLDKHRKENKVAVIHLHGTTTSEPDRSQFRLTEEDLYREGYDPMMREFERYLYSTEVFVFVGYSMNDPNIKYLYRKYMQDFKHRKKLDRKTYIVYPRIKSENDSENLYEWGNELSKLVWEGREMIWINMDAAEFFSELLERVKEINDEALLQKIKSKYQLESNGVTNKIESTMQITKMDRENTIAYLALEE